MSGHYWAYIKSRRRATWLKFNDITVTEATWDELQRESVGGYHNTSAYCLMYVDRNNEQLLDGGLSLLMLLSHYSASTLRSVPASIMTYQ